MAQRKIKVGDRVQWLDPAVNDYTKKQLAEQRATVYIVDEIDYENEIALIHIEGFDPLCQTEVPPWELRLRKKEN